MAERVGSHAVGGRYYLPHRGHATREQVRVGYRMVRDFFEAKRRHDPHERFRNRFYQQYGPR